MSQDTNLRKDLNEDLWRTSITGAFRTTQMGYFLYSSPRDLAEMLSPEPDSTARTKALLEYTQRGEWRKAAKVARILDKQYSFVKDEIKTIFGRDGSRKLLDDPLEQLPTIIYK